MSLLIFENSDTEFSNVLKPPVDIVVNEWFKEEKKSIPERVSRRVCNSVNNK